MLFKPFYFLALSFLLLVFLTTEALACRPSDAVCLNQSCNEFDLGTTALDFDKKKIIACLKNDAGQKVWKSMTVSSSSGSSTTGSCQEELYSYYCKASSPAYCTSTKRCACPVGYQLIQTGSEKGQHSTSGEPDFYNYYINYYLCIAS